MKLLIITCLLMASTALSAQQIANTYEATKTDWQKMELKGKVKTLKSYTYTAQQKNGKTIKKALKKTEDHVVIPTIAYYSFSPEGYLTEEIGYSDKEKEIYHKNLHYNPQNQLLLMEHKIFDSNNKEVYEYQKNQLQMVKTYINGEYYQDFDATYLTKGGKYLCQGTDNCSEYQYDSNGKLLKTVSYRIGGSRFDVTKYTYNKQGQLTRADYFTGPGGNEHYSTEIYQYLTTDSQGNVTQKAIQIKDHNNRTTYQLIEYQITYY